MRFSQGCSCHLNFESTQSNWLASTGRLWKVHKSQCDINSEPALFEGCEYMITAHLPYINLKDRRPWLWTAIIRHVTERHDDGAHHTRHEVCSLYSCNRYVIVFNSVFSLLERYGHSEFVLRSMGATTDWPGFWASCSSSCMLYYLSNNEVEVLMLVCTKCIE